MSPEPLCPLYPSPCAFRPTEAVYGDLFSVDRPQSPEAAKELSNFTKLVLLYLIYATWHRAVFPETVRGGSSAALWKPPEGES